MRCTVIEDEVVREPVGKLVCLPAELVVKDEIVVRPFQSVAESRGESIYFELLVVVQDVPHQIGVGV